MKYIAVVAAFVLMVSACKNDKEFAIEGKVENAGSIKKVLLYETDQLIDSAFLNAEGEFIFKRSSADPQFYTLMIGEKNFMVIAENGDEIEFETNLTDTTSSYTVEGSEASEKIREFNTLSNKYGKIYKQIEEDFTKRVQQNPESKDAVMAELMPKFQSNVDAYSKEALNFAEKNKDNLAGFYAAGTVDQIKYEEQLIKYAEEVGPKFPNNKPVQAFVTKMKEIKPVSIGQMAPQFSSNTPDGKTVNLADFKGKYVLIDFWASWCAPCREENPNIVKQYNRFKDKNFTILGVSLDDDKTAWEKAIAADNLTWTHVSELKRWDGEVAKKYKVEGIPASFMIDPTGKIVAKNLRGKELETFLSSNLK